MHIARRVRSLRRQRPNEEWWSGGARGPVTACLHLFYVRQVKACFLTCFPGTGETHCVVLRCLCAFFHCRHRDLPLRMGPHLPCSVHAALMQLTPACGAQRALRVRVLGAIDCPQVCQLHERVCRCACPRFGRGSHHQHSTRRVHSYQVSPTLHPFVSQSSSWHFFPRVPPTVTP